MAKKTTKKTSKNLKASSLPKDYDVVTFIVPLPEKSKMPLGEFDGIVHSIYLNKYGAQIGGLIQLEGSNDFLSLDFKTYEYFLRPESIKE